MERNSLRLQEASVQAAAATLTAADSSSLVWWGTFFAGRANLARSKVGMSPGPWKRLKPPSVRNKVLASSENEVLETVKNFKSGVFLSLQISIL